MADIQSRSEVLSPALPIATTPSITSSNPNSNAFTFAEFASTLNSSATNSHLVLNDIEAARIRILKESCLIETESEEGYDAVVRLITRRFKVSFPLPILFDTMISCV